VIILSLAVCDRVKAEGLAASVEPDARNAGSSRATAAEGDAIQDSDSRVWPPPSSRSVEKSNASYNGIEIGTSAGRAEAQSRRHPPLDDVNRRRTAGRYQSMLAFSTNCLGSIVVSFIGTLILLALLRGWH